MGPPAYQRSLRGIVVAEIILRHFYGQPLVQISAVFIAERIGSILGVAGQENLGL